MSKSDPNGSRILAPEHQTVRLTPKASRVLYYGQAVQMLIRKEQGAPARPAAVTKLSGDEAELYDVLRELGGTGHGRG